MQYNGITLHRGGDSEVPVGQKCMEKYGTATLTNIYMIVMSQNKGKVMSSEYRARGQRTKEQKHRVLVFVKFPPIKAVRFFISSFVFSQTNLAIVMRTTVKRAAKKRIKKNLVNMYTMKISSFIVYLSRLERKKRNKWHDRNRLAWGKSNSRRCTCNCLCI